MEGKVFNFFHFKLSNSESSIASVRKYRRNVQHNMLFAFVCRNFQRVEETLLAPVIEALKPIADISVESQVMDCPSLSKLVVFTFLTYYLCLMSLFFSVSGFVPYAEILIFLLG